MVLAMLRLSSLDRSPRNCDLLFHTFCRAARSVGDQPCLIYKRFAESAQIEGFGPNAVFEQFRGQISIVKIGGSERNLEIRVSFQLAPLFVIMGSIPVPKVT